MKCSTCGFITDPSKDLCSRCFGDLRKDKLALGFAVVNPGASYQELLAKRVRIVEKRKKEVTKRESGKSSGFLERILSWRQKLAPESQQPLVPIPASETFKESEAESSAPALEAQKLKLSKRQRQQMLGLLRKRKSKEEEQGLKAQKEQQAIDKTQTTESPLTIGLQDRQSEEMELWELGFQEIAALSSQVSHSSAIQVSSLLRQDSHSALSVYFDLAFEELSAPHKKREFITQLGDRRVDRIESQELEAAVGKYHKDSARIAGEAYNQGTIGQVGVAAGLWIRLLAWWLDFSFALLSSLILGVFLYLSSSPLLSSMLLGARSFSLSDIFSIAIFSLPIFYLTLFLFFPAARSLLGFTAGEYFTKLRLLSATDNGRPTFIASLGWSLLSVMAFISLGLLEIRRGSELWREKVIGARLLRT